MRALFTGLQRGKSLRVALVVIGACALAGCALVLALQATPAAYASDGENSSSSSQIESISDLPGKRVGGVIGTASFADGEKACQPGGTGFGFNNTADALQALDGRKVDAVATDEPVARYSTAGKPNFKVLDEYISSIQYGFMFAKSGGSSDKLLSQINDFIAKIKADGTLEDIWETWWGADNSKKVVDYSSLDGPNGTLRVATSSAVGPPVIYVKDNQFMGADVDILTRFCKEYGYKLEISDMDVSGVIASVSTGKSDLGAFGATITDERKQSVRFSDVYYDGGTSVVVKSGDAQGSGIIDAFISGFQRTFIDENRWQLFVEGGITTLAISILSILFGTILGFLVFLLVRRGGKISNKIANFCIWLVTGLPTVVLLMVFFYVVFAQVAISGAAVAIVAFSLTFAASTIGMLRVGENAVDSGQSEAARALGYSDARAFREIILPQAIRHILPTYQSETITLLKATAVVGYIAVRDLTKVGDIIRSATYDAIFPLLAVAVVYLILEACIKRIVRFTQKKLDGNGKEAGGILKDVVQVEHVEQSLTESDLEKVRKLLKPVEQNGEEVLRFEDVGKKFGDNVILEHVNATVKTGDVIAIIGPSGCGKSTIMRTVNLLGPATSGKVFLKGEDIMDPKYDTKKLYRQVGMVFQRWNLFGHWTVLENLMRPQMDLCGISAQEAYDNAILQLRFMGLQNKAFSYPHELSGGQQQRIAILRAFATDPAVVLMDEPTSALDPTMVDEVKEALIALAEAGVTMMVVSHDMKFSRAVCNRVFYMDEKGLYEDGPTEQIFVAPERPKTRDFIASVETMSIDIVARNFDVPKAHATLENYFVKQGANAQTSKNARHFFIQMVEKTILPRLSDPLALRFVAIYNEEKRRAILTVWYSGETFDPLPDDESMHTLTPYLSDRAYAQVEEGAFTNRLDVVFYEE